MSVSMDNIGDKINSNMPLNDAEQQHQLIRFNHYKVDMNDSNLNNWFAHAIADENVPLLEAVLNHANVPANLTLKEKIVYYQLLKN